MKISIILTAVMAFMTGATAALNSRDAEEFGVLAAELAVRGVPNDIIDSMYGLMAKRNADTDPVTVTVCSTSTGVLPPPVASSAPGSAPIGTPTPSGAPPATGTPGVPATESTGVPTVAPPAETNPPPATGATPPATTTTPAGGPSGIVPPNSTTITTGTATGTATVPSTTAPSSTQTPAAPNDAGSLKMNIAVIGVAALAAFY